MSENRRIARAAGLVSGLTLLSRVGGLIRDAVVGYFFGTGPAADAFFVAFRVPNLLRRFVAEGAMSVAFIPVFSDYLANRGESETVRAARSVATLMAVVLAVLTVAGVLCAPIFVRLFAPGFVGESGKFALTVALTRRVFPYLFFIGMVALANGLLNAYRHFAAPAMSPIFLNLAIIAAVIVLCPRLPQPVYGLAYGVLIGGVLQLLVQIPPLLARGLVLWPRWEPRHPAIGRSLWLLAPTLAGAAMYQINVMVNTALASVLPGGSVSYLWYADRVFEFPVGLFAAALGTAALPSFATQAARGAYGELRESVGFAIRVTNFIAVPAMVGILSLATPIVTVLFQRGAFGRAEVALTAQALVAFTVGLWSLSIVRILVPAFYAMNDTRTPVLTAAASFVTNMCCSLMFMGPVPVRGESVLADGIAGLASVLAVVNLRHAGLALATSVAATVNLVLLVTVLRQRLDGLAMLSLLSSLVRSLAAALVMVVPVRWLAGCVDWTEPGQLAVKLGTLLAAVCLGMAVFGTVAYLLGGEDVGRISRFLRDRLRRSDA